MSDKADFRETSADADHVDSRTAFAHEAWSQPKRVVDKEQTDTQQAGKHAKPVGVVNWLNYGATERN